jgi:hypothetical protein
MNDRPNLVISSRSDRERTEEAFLALLADDPRFVVGRVESVREAERMVRDDFRSITLFLKARWLHAEPTFEWGNFSGRRCLLDHDIYANYADDRRIRGAWDPVFAANHFDVVITTGLRVRDRLLADGIHAVWLPKAYDPEAFFDLGGKRGGWCTFGTRYPARRAIGAKLARTMFEVTNVRAPYRELNAQLNRFVGCVICNLDGTFRFGRYGRKACDVSGDRLVPLLVRVGGPTEVMLKNFEAAAAGCAVVCDRSDDVAALGFVDGESVILYGDPDELVEKLREYREPETLRRIAASGRDLVHSRHTWAHRIEEFHSAIIGPV